MFPSVKLRQTYSQCVRITNPLEFPVEFSIRAGSPIRYKISPSVLTLKGGESALVEIRLRVLTHTKPKASFTNPAVAGTALSSAASGASSEQVEKGIKDIFHIRSEFFTQKFYASWFAWGSHAPTSAGAAGNAAAASSASSSVAHNLPDSTLEGYEREGGAAGIRAQRTEDAEARKNDRLKAKAQAASESAKAQAEAELHRPFERSSILTQSKVGAEERPSDRSSSILAQAKQPLSHTALLPPSLGGGSTLHGAAAPSLSSVTNHDFLALTQAHRQLGSEVDRKNLEIQQWEFNYSQLEQECKFLSEQLAAAKSSQPQPVNVQAQVDELLRAERAEVERKNQKVLALLMSKDAQLREKDSEISSLLSQIDEYAQALSQVEESLALEKSQAASREKKMQQKIDEMHAALTEAAAQAASAAQAAAQAASVASSKDQATYIASLLAKQEELIGERDASEASNASLRFQVSSLEQSLKESKMAVKRSAERVEQLTSQLRDAESHVAAHSNGPENSRQQEQIETLIRELHEARQSKLASDAVAAADPYAAPAATATQQEWSQEKEEMTNLIVELQEKHEMLSTQLRQAQSEAHKQIASLQHQLASQQQHPQSSSASGLDAPAVAPSSSQQLASNSAVLSAKQREVEDLRRQNGELQDRLRDSEHTAQRLRNQLPSTAATPTASAAATIDSLRAQLLLVESELASKSHSLSTTQASKRELESRLSELEQLMTASRAQVQASEARADEAHRKWLAASRAQEELTRTQQQLGELESRLAEMTAREAQKDRASAELESRLEASSKATERFYQQEMHQLKKMMQSMIVQTQNACAGGGSSAVAAASNPSLQASSLSAIDASALLSDFHAVLASLSSLTASRDTHKLSAIRAEKRLQFLERQSLQFQNGGIEAAERAAALAVEHREEIDALRAEHEAAMTKLESKLSRSGAEIARLSHALSAQETSTSQALATVESLESSNASLAGQLKRLQSEQASSSHQSSLEADELRLEAAKGLSMLAEKSSQIEVLMETIEALQKAAAAAWMVERNNQAEAAAAQSSIAADSASAIAVPALSVADVDHPSAYAVLSSKLIIFAAHLSHAKSQESLLRRSLKSQESILLRLRSTVSFQAEELSAAQGSIVGLEKKVARNTLSEKALKTELHKMTSKLAAKNEELSEAASTIAKNTAAQSLLAAQIDTLTAEAKAARKRHVDSMAQAQEECKRMVREYAKSHGGVAIEPQQQQQGLRLSSSSNSTQLPLAGPELVAALKELSASIAQASGSTLPIHAHLFSPFTPQKKRSSAAASSAGAAASTITAVSGSPQFVLGSPSKPASATVAPSANEGAAILPAIFERLLNILLANESSLLQAEGNATLQSFQLSRMTVSLLARETELDSLRSALAIAQTNHDKALVMLHAKNNSNQAFQSEQNRTVHEQMQEAQRVLFQTQSDLLAAQSDLVVVEKALAKRQSEIDRLRRSAEVAEQEHAHQLLLVESTAEASAEKKWRSKSEELKLYVEQVIRPLLLVDESQSAPQTEVGQQLSALASSVTSMKLLESSTLAETETLRKSVALLEQQIAGWKAQCKAMEVRMKELGEEYVQTGSNSGADSKRRSSVSAAAALGVSQSQRVSSSRSHDAPRERDRRTGSRSRSPPPSRGGRDSDRRRSRSPPQQAARRASSKVRSQSPSDSHRSSASAAEQIRALEDQVEKLGSQLRKSTGVQQQLEDTIEQLLDAKREYERQLKDAERELDRFREDEEATAGHSSDDGGDGSDSKPRGKSGSRSSSTSRSGSRSGSGSKAAAATAPTARGVPAAASKPTASSRGKVKSSAAAGAGSTKGEAADTSMANTLAHTVLQVSKQLRERDRAADDSRAELAKVAASVKEGHEEIAKLTASLAKKKTEVKDLQSQLEKRDADLLARSSALSQCEDRSAALAAQVASLESSTTSLNAQLAAMTSLNSAASGKLAQDLVALQQSIPAGVENAALKSQLASLQGQLTHSLGLENAERARNVELVGQLKTAEELRMVLQGEIAALKAARDNLSTKVESLREDFKKDRAGFEIEIAGREAEKKSMATMLATLEQSRAELHQSHTHLLREKELHEHDAGLRIAALEEQVAKEIESRHATQSREQDMLDKLHHLESEKQASIDAQALAAESYRTDLTRMKQSTAILESTLENARKEISELVHIQGEHELLTHELNALRCQHMDYLAQVSMEREAKARMLDATETELAAAQNALKDKSEQMAEEVAHQKNLYTEMLNKLKQRIQQMLVEQEESDKEAAALERKLDEVTDMNVANAAARVKAEEERDVLVSRYESLEKARAIALAESEAKAAVDSQIAAQEFKNLQRNFEDYRRGHESLCEVYEGQHQRLLARMRKMLETVQDLQQARDIKDKRAAEKKDMKDRDRDRERATNASLNTTASTTVSSSFVSETGRNRLVFDMTELLSNLAEREAVVRNLTAEIDQYKRALAAAQASGGSGADKISVARPLTAILTASSSTHATAPTVLKLSKSVGRGTAPASNKENVHTAQLNLRVEELAPPLTWAEERSLAVLGSELAHMEVQLKHAQRLQQNEAESAAHFEQQCQETERQLNATKEKLRATQKELAALQRHTTGTIKAQEAEIVKITASLRTEEEWVVMSRAVQEGKTAVKLAKDDLARKAKQLSIAADDQTRLRAQLEELEIALAGKEGKVAKLTRALGSKDVLIADLKRKFDELEAQDKHAEESSAVQGDKLRLATTQLAKKEASIKELKSKLEAAEKEMALQTQQISEMAAAQSQLKQATKELSAAHKQVDELTEERALLEKQKIELHNQIEVARTASAVHAQGQKSQWTAHNNEPDFRSV